MEPTTKTETTTKSDDSKTVRININIDMKKDNDQKVVDKLQKILQSCGVDVYCPSMKQLAEACSAPHGGSAEFDAPEDLESVNVSVHPVDQAELVGDIKRCSRFSKSVPKDDQALWIAGLLQLHARGYTKWHKCFTSMRKIGFEGDIEPVIKAMIEQDEARKQKKEARQAAKKLAKGDSDDEKSAETKKSDENATNPDAFPEGVSHLLLDANNMIFITSTLRNVFLKRKGGKGKKCIENVFFDIAKQFAAKHAELKSVTVLFDGRCKRREVTNENGTVIVLKGCVPDFQIADDALVAWAVSNPSKCTTALVATSDRELRDRLTSAGVKYLMKSGSWMRSAMSDLCENSDADLDDWVKTFVPQ